MIMVVEKRKTSGPHRSGWSIPSLIYRLFLCMSCLSFPVTVILVNVVEQTSVGSSHPHFSLDQQLKHHTSKNNEKNHGKYPAVQKSDAIIHSTTKQMTTKTKTSNGNGNGLLEDKERLIEALQSQNVHPSDIDPETWAQIPTWTQITELYGTKPIVIGLDQCQTFRDKVPEEKRIIAPAGLFNTGTNLIAQLLEHNCYFPKRLSLYGRKHRAPGMAWQTPWGKHSPPEFRNKTVQDPLFQHMDKDHVLPVVAMREPYEWMKSTCHNNYVLRWPHQHKCPNLIYPNGTLIEVYNQYFHGSIRRYHKSLAHFWNDWNRQYIHNPGFPRLMVRHKDLIFYPQETIELVCECAGAKLINEANFTYIMEAAKQNRKGHKPFDGLVGNWIKYGKHFRTDEFSKEDMKVAKEVLDQSIMDMFQFKW